MSKQRILQDQICDQLIVEQDQHSGWICFNDPARHNAVSYEMWQGISLALDYFSQTAAIKSVVLSGAGDKAFVSGANISQFDTLRTGPEAVQEYERVAEHAQLALRDFPKPLIAMIQGYCVGGGLNIALSCDIRLASDDSMVSLPAGKLGLGYRFSAIQNLVRAVGTANALEIFLTADRYTAQEALAKGLLHKVVARDELVSTVTQYVERINANAPLTLQAGKKMINALADRTEQIDLQLMQDLIMQCFNSDDYREGKLAFAQKRPPQFQGR